MHFILQNILFLLLLGMTTSLFPQEVKIYTWEFVDFQYRTKPTRYIADITVYCQDSCLPYSDSIGAIYLDLHDSVVVQVRDRKGGVLPLNGRIEYVIQNSMAGVKSIMWDTLHNAQSFSFVPYKLGLTYPDGFYRGLYIDFGGYWGGNETLVVSEPFEKIKAYYRRIKFFSFRKSHCTLGVGFRIPAKDYRE